MPHTCLPSESKEAMVTCSLLSFPTSWPPFPGPPSHLHTHFTAPGLLGCRDSLTPLIKQEWMQVPGDITNVEKGKVTNSNGSESKQSHMTQCHVASQKHCTPSSSESCSQRPLFILTSLVFCDLPLVNTQQRGL